MSGYAWNKEELAILIDKFPKGGARLVNALLPHRTITSIYLRANKLGISKPGKSTHTPEWLAAKRITRPAPGVLVHRLL